MACSSLQNLKRQLINKGLISLDNTIKDDVALKKLHQLSESYKIASEKKYKVTGNLFSISEGRVVFHSAMFEKIDKVKEALEPSFAPEQQDGYQDYLEQSIDFDVGGDYIEPNFTKYIRYKENQIVRIKAALNKVRINIKSAKEDITETKKLRALENELDLLLNGDPDNKTLSLRDKIEEMKEDGYLSVMEETSNRDLELAAKQIESGSFDNLKAARETVEFYSALGNFNLEDNDNPIFNFDTRQIKRNEDGSLAIEDSVKETLGLIAIKANNLAIDLSAKDRTMISDHIMNYGKVKNLGVDVDWEYLFPSKGMKDIGIYDLLMMDVTNGLTSTNGLVPQYMRSYLGDVIAKSSYRSSQIVGALEAKDKTGRTLQQRVNRALVKIDKKYKIGPRGASYDFFRQRDSNGSYTGAVVERYSSNYESSFFEAASRFISKRKQAFASVSGGDIELRAASNGMRDWIKDNAILVRPEVFSEVYGILGLAVPNIDSTYSDSMIDKLGQKHYEDIKKEVIRKVKEFKVKKEVYLDSLLEKENVKDYDSLSTKGKNFYTFWDKNNNPLTASRNFYQSKANTLGSLQFNTIVPNPKVEGHYDSDFKTIEGNKDLSDFYEILGAFKDQIEELPTSVKKKILRKGIPHMQQSLIEILTDPNTKRLAKVSKTFRTILDSIIEMFREIKQSEKQVGLVNPLTGKPDYKVSDDFLKNNKEEIQVTYDTMMAKIAMVTSSDVLVNQYNMDLNELSVDAKGKVLNVLKELYGVNTDAELQARLPNEDLSGKIELSKLIKAGATHRIVADESVDLPKIIKYYTKMISVYQARNLALPMLEAIKKRYENVSDTALTKEGKSISNVNREGKEEARVGVVGKRANAIKQMDSWFERAVLGNYGSKSEVGDLITSKKALTAKEKEIEALLISQEKQIQEELDKLLLEKADITEEEDVFDASDREGSITLLKGALDKNHRRQERLGGNLSVKKGLDQMFNLVRFLGLGYNINSYITNFMEGQSSNLIGDSSGDYWEPGLIYEANNIIKGSFLKYASFNNVVTKGAAITRICMDRYDTLQDQTNELQKASNNSAIASINRLSPYAGTQRVEYLNQAPVMVALLLDTKIQGVDAEGKEITSSVFHAMDKEGNMIEGFNNVKNNENWVDGVGQDYLDFKGKLDKSLVNLHGDYDALRGTMGSEYISGKAVLMYKKWLARQIWARFGVQQMDLEAGISDFKGRYLSHDKVSASMHGAVLGFGGLALIGAGITGIGLGAASGYLVGKLLQDKQGGTKLGVVDSLKELTFLTGQLILNPFKFTLNNITGKQIIKEGKFADNLPGYSSRDVKNIRTNISEMSLTLMWLAGILAAKALLWDDEDEEDSISRVAHNLLVNKMMALSNSLGMYNNPETMIKNIGEPAIVRLFVSIKKVCSDFNDLTQGNDTNLSGTHAGQSGLKRELIKSFLPNILKGQFGFESQMKKQFAPSPYDAMFWGETKIFSRKNRELRAVYKYQLERQGHDDKTTAEAVRRRFPGKEKKYSQKEWFEKIKGNQAIDISSIRKNAKGEIIKLKKRKKIRF